jgi:hypothetical protein
MFHPEEAVIAAIVMPRMLYLGNQRELLAEEKTYAPDRVST